MPAPAPAAFAACVHKNLILSTRGARAGPADRAGPAGVLAWRALSQAALVALVFGVLRSADTRPAPLPARSFPPLPLGLPVWADDYAGPAARTHWRGTLAVSPGSGGDSEAFRSAAAAFAAALACGWGSADGSPSSSGGRPPPSASPDPASRSFRSLWRRPPSAATFPDPVAAVCDGGGPPCAAERACWAHLLIRGPPSSPRAEGSYLSPLPPAPRPGPGLVLFPSWEEALAAAGTAWPDAFDAAVGLGWWGSPPPDGDPPRPTATTAPAAASPRYKIAANATLLPPAPSARPGSAAAVAGSSGSALDPPAAHRAAWFVANLQAALEGAAGGGGGGTPAPIPLLSFKPFPAPPATADATALLVGALLQLAVAYAALAPGRRAAASLAGEAGAQRAALAAAGLPGSVYWSAWAAAHALEAAAAAAAFGAAASLAVPGRAAVLAAALAGLATAAVVAGAYVVSALLASRGPTAAADAFTACYVALALPGYLAPSLPAGSRAAAVAWAVARTLPPSSAVLAGAGAGVAAGVARAGGGWGAMLSAPAAPGGGEPGAPTVGGLLACLVSQALALAATAGCLDAAAARRAGGRRGPGALPRPVPSPAPPPPAGDAEAGAPAPLAPGDPYPPGPAAEAVALVKSYPGERGAPPTPALAGLDLVAPRAAVTALLGPSGAGKSTAVACLTGEVAPSSGTARLGGVEPAAARDAGVSVGLCPQADVAWPALTVREHMALWAAIKGSPSLAAAAAEAASAAASVGLAPKLDARASELSGGQRRALGTAAALVRAPDVAVLDEPTAGLDAAARARVWAALAARPAGSAALLATHALEEVEAAADAAVVIGRGRALAAGPPGELRDRFGGGYRLAVSWGERDGEDGGGVTPSAVAEEVAALVAASAPCGGAPLPGGPPGNTARFRLAATDAPAFPTLLRALSAATPRLGLTGVALSVAPLEDAVAALTADADGAAEEEGGPETPAVLPPSLTPASSTRPTLRRLALARVAALARSALSAARARPGAEAWAVLTGAGAVAFGAYLAASTSAGVGGGGRHGPAGPPLALGRPGALGGTPAGLAGAPSTAPLLPALAAALGPPPAMLWPSVTSPGPGGLGPPPLGSMDAALLAAVASGAPPTFDALFAGWPGPGGAVLLANGSAPLGLFGAVAASLPALLAVRGGAPVPPPSASPTLTPLAPGASALVSAVAAAAGGWVFAFELVTATAVAAGGAARRAATARAGGAATAARLAGASPSVRLAAAGLAEGARLAAWLGGGLAATAALGPPDLARPRPLAALAALGAAGSAAATLLAWVGARAPATPDPDAAALAPGRAAWAAVGAGAAVGGLRFAPLLLPAHARALRGAATALHTAAVAALPPYNLLRGVLAVALTDEAQPARAGAPALLALSTRRGRRLAAHPAPLSWAAAGQPLACLAAQVLAFGLLALWGEGRPEGEAAGVGAVAGWARRGGASRRGERGEGGSPSLLGGGEGGGTAGGGDPGAAAERAACARLLADAAATTPPVTLLVAGATKAFPAGPAAAGGRASGTPPWLPRPRATVPALTGAWLRVCPGETVGVVGSNGAGKTTLFRLVVGELAPDGGLVSVCGRPAAGGRGRVGYCPQGPSLPPDLSALDAVASLALLRGVRRGEAASAAAALLACLGLPASAAASRPLATLSGGQARRAGVAAALVGAPPLIVLDEPSTGLDARARARLWATVRAAAAASAAPGASPSAVLVSSHRLDEVEAACGRVVVLARGRVAAAGAPAALRAAHGGGGVRVRVLPAPGGGTSAADAAAAAAAALGAPLDCIQCEPGGRGAVLRLGGGDGGGDQGGPLTLADVYERLEAARASGSLGGFSASGATLEDAFLALAEGGRG